MMIIMTPFATVPFAAFSETCDTILHAERMRMDLDARPALQAILGTTA